MRNSSLVEWFCAENVTGLSVQPKLRHCSNALGRGASYAGRSQSGSTGGLHTSENAGISSENYVRIIMAENLRFPGEGSSAQGKSGPKSRPKGVDDGQTVDIPLPSYRPKQGHRRIVRPRGWKAVGKHRGRSAVKYTDHEAGV